MDKIKQILKNLRPEYDFDISTNFVNDGFLDSFDLVALISELDENFGISIDGLDIVPENFVNWDSILDVVKKNGGNV